MKPIETKWNGYRFRSRLEARWAIFFTQMKMAFQYEPEGFEFSDGTRYLPDFLLPEINMWAEVKPVHPTPEELCKAEWLVTESKSHLLFLVGPPDFCHYKAMDYDSGGITPCEYSLDIYAHRRRYYDTERRLYAWPEWHSEDECSDEFRAAIWLSRAERFDREVA